ncbi:MAG: hypothetical protein EOO65_00015 [Methanosarcinales archaeon]|nr:MAG: hypothetical protein EOO65_00015 [Methanosarcinales archaeon]
MFVTSTEGIRNSTVRKVWSRVCRPLLLVPSFVILIVVLSARYFAQHEIIGSRRAHSTITKSNNIEKRGQTFRQFNVTSEGAVRKPYFPPKLDTCFTEYAMLHSTIISGQAVESEMKYVAWSVERIQGSGLGNRILGFVSTFGLALATNRALLLKQDEKISSVFNSSPTEEGGIDWAYESAMEIFEKQTNRKPTIKHFEQDIGMSEWCACGEEAFEGVDVVTVDASQYFWPCITHNPAWRETLRQKLGDSFEIFRWFLLRYLQLKPELQSMVDHFDSTILHPMHEKRFVVGLQIRSQHLVRKSHEESVFKRCARAVGAQALQRHDSDRQRFTDESLLALLRDAHENAGASPIQKLKLWKEREREKLYFFAVSDSDDVKNSLRNEFGDQLLEFTFPKESNLPPSAGAAIDMGLLARTDAAIITWPRSTFGIVGAAMVKSGAPPYVVMSGSKRADECVALLSTEPCFHGWFSRWKLSCYSPSKFETPEMLNQHNCYMWTCGWHSSKSCTGSDIADGFLHPQTPFEYSSFAELGTQFWIPSAEQHKIFEEERGQYEEFMSATKLNP